MDSFEVWGFPIKWTDLSLICDILRKENVFVPGFGPDVVDAYDPLSYCRQLEVFGNEFVLIADRNVVTRILAIKNGVEPTYQHRVVAAVMTFASCTDINFEPNIAVYEVASTEGNRKANEELQLFRIADNLHPKYWKDIALDRKKFDISAQFCSPNSEEITSFDFTTPLRRWNRNYILALKIAELSLLGGKSEERMIDVMRWMYDDFLIGGPAVMLASHYLAPNNNRKGLLKNLKSPDRELAILGVKNAAWDLTLLSEWLRQVDVSVENKKLAMLCSLDKKLIDFAKTLVSGSQPVDLKDHFVKLWGVKRGLLLLSFFENCRKNAGNPDRQLNREASKDFIDQKIYDGELIVRNWVAIQ